MGLVSSLELIIHKAEAQSCGETDSCHSTDALNQPVDEFGLVQI